MPGLPLSDNPGYALKLYLAPAIPGWGGKMSLANKKPRESILRCFLSYATQDKPHAEFLRSQIESLYPETIDVFLACDPRSLPPGQKWYEELLGYLRKIRVLFVLLSPSSIGRPWLLFEAGAAVALNVKIIPMRYHGLTPDLVPGPLAPFQSLDLSLIDDIVQMLKDLATARSPAESAVKQRAKSIAQYFGRVGGEEAEAVLGGRPLPALSDRVHLLSLSSDTQRRLFFHVYTWEGTAGILESDIRKGVPIPYHRHNRRKRQDLQISPSEYYFRLRELYLLGLLEMKKVSKFENRWWVVPEVRDLVKRYHPSWGVG